MLPGLVLATAVVAVARTIVVTAFPLVSAVSPEVGVGSGQSGVLFGMTVAVGRPVAVG